MLVLEYFLIIVTIVNGVRIKQLHVPQSVRNNTNMPIVLDCDYSFDSYDDTRGFVLKWYLNNDHNTIYQWIPPHRPQVLHELKNEIDVNFTINSHPYKKYRAIKVINPTTKLSGSYKCLVSTFMDEDFHIKSMTVYEPEKYSTFFQEIEHVNNTDDVHLTCLIIGIFPEPKVTIYSFNVTAPNVRERIEPNLYYNRAQENGRYDVSVTVNVSRSIYESSESEFECRIRIPNTSYIRKIKLKDNFFESSK